MYVGGDVRCAEYALSGSAEVGANAVKALQGRGAALLANHGMVAVGPSPAKVLHIVAIVERTAQIAWGGPGPRRRGAHPGQGQPRLRRRLPADAGALAPRAGESEGTRGPPRR